MPGSEVCSATEPSARAQIGSSLASSRVAHPRAIMSYGLSADRARRCSALRRRGSSARRGRATYAAAPRHRRVLRPGEARRCTSSTLRLRSFPLPSAFWLGRKPSTGFSASARNVRLVLVLEEEGKATGRPNGGQAVRGFIHQNDKWG